MSNGIGSGLKAARFDDLTKEQKIEYYLQADAIPREINNKYDAYNWLEELEIDDNWFTFAKDLIFKLGKKSQLIDDERKEIKRFFFMVHGLWSFDKHSQKNYDVSSSGSSVKQLCKLNRVYSVASIFSLGKLKQLLKTDEFIQKDNIIIISSNNLDTALFKRGENYIFLDENNKEHKIHENFIEELAKKTYDAHFRVKSGKGPYKTISYLDYSIQRPLGIQIFSFEKTVSSYPEVSHLLKEFASFPQEEKNGCSGLVMAAQINSLESLQYYLINDGDPNLINENGLAAVHLAAKYGYTKILQTLLSNEKLHIFESDKEGWTALELAAKYNHSDIVKILLNINVKPKGHCFYKNALVVAAYHGNDEIVKELIRAGVSNLSFEDSLSALMSAANYGQANVVKTLLSKNEYINVQYETGDTAFMQAVAKCYVEVVDEFLKNENVDLNIQNKKGKTALMIAISNADCSNKFFANDEEYDKGRELANASAKIANKIVLKDNVDLNLRDNEGNTALMLAVQSDMVAFGVLAELLSSNHIINPNLQNLCGHTALMLAAKKGVAYAVKELLRMEGIDVNKQSGNGTTAIMLASLGGHADAVRELLKSNKVDLKIKNREGENAFILSSHFRENAKAFRELITSETDFDDEDIRGRTVFMLAAERGNIDIVRILLQKNIDLNKQDIFGKTALMLASSYNKKEVAKELLACKEIDVNMQDENGNTALMEAVDGCNLDVVEMLLADDNIDVNIKNNKGETALMMAAKDKCIDTFGRLMRFQDVLVNVKNNEGQTALMLAANKDQFAMIQAALYKRDVDLDEQDDDGLTALMIAAQKNHHACAEELLNAKANPNIKSRNGWTALMLAIDNDFPETVKVLLKSPYIDINARNNDGSTALIMAVKSCHFEIVKLLLSKEDIDMNIQDDSGATALIYAARFGQLNIVKMLLSNHNTNIGLRKHDGLTAFGVAVKNGHLEVVKELIIAGANLDDNCFKYDFSDELDSLMLAAKSGYGEIVKELLFNRNVKCSKEILNGLSAISLAKTEEIKELIKEHAIKEKDEEEISVDQLFN